MDSTSGNCEEIQILISRFVDDEVTDEERSRVESHVLTCKPCSYVMLQYVEMAALFAESPTRQPEPDLRASLFREISNVTEAAQRQTRATAQSSRPWYLLADKAQPAPLATAPLPSFAGRLIRAASPLMMAAVPIVFIIGALVLSSKFFVGADAPVTERSGQVPIQPLPTYEAPLAQITSDAAVVPPAQLTKAPGVITVSTAAATTTYLSATATLGPYQLIKLAQPTPVWEDGDAVSKTGWHSMRDPQYGYKLSYPSNWWTRVLNNTRYFYPWGAGGTEYAPYRVQLSVQPNTAGLTAATANDAVCSGACDTVNDVWLKRNRQDANDFYHEGYLFDASYIYRLQLVVPVTSLDGLGDFQDRIAAGEQIFGTMSGRLALADASTRQVSAFDNVLFLKGSKPDQGSDLYLAASNGSTAHRLTWDGGIKNYALSPDMESVAYAATDKNQARDAWASRIYLATIAPANSSDLNALPLAGMDAIHDLAWYSDHELVFLAENGGTLGLYRLVLPATPGQKPAPTPELLVALGAGLAGAR
ncbi:MAG: anti-sigma factor, partial [Chloroflexota bacterium]